jgi:FlaA1/EpsC-like NDP-sugar epimerase
MLGNNREIFFPRLEEAQMMTFDKIAAAFLKENGYDVLLCETDEEAIEKAEDLKKGSNLYPVHFSGSNTSGEKAYEEFYTDSESVDFERLSALGIVTDKPIPDKEKVNVLFEQLNAVFEKEEATKEEVVEIMRAYLPNFEHIETGKCLDSKM